jgi:hypothetical protein
MDVWWWLSVDNQWEGQGERERYFVVKRMEVHYIYTYKVSIMELAKSESGGDGEGEWKYDGWGNLLKVHYIQV